MIIYKADHMAMLFAYIYNPLIALCDFSIHKNKLLFW